MSENLDELIEAQVEREDLSRQKVLLKHINKDLIEIFLLDNHPRIRSAVYYQRKTPEGNILSFGTLFYKPEDSTAIKNHLPVKNEIAFIGYIDKDHDVIKIVDR
ncbi:MAG TPA: hypothetical protein VJJ23_03805 [Candidatus Nanoarchaeia archaeon]|nr:hypothetical protein [Candidatus Nanoarchaeia archaeon]